MSPNTLTTRPTISTLTAWHNPSTCAARSSQRRCVRSRGPSGSSCTGSWTQRVPLAASIAASKQRAAPARGAGTAILHRPGISTWIHRPHVHAPIGNMPHRIHGEVPPVAAAVQHLDGKLRPCLALSEPVPADLAAIRRAGRGALRDQAQRSHPPLLVRGIRHAEKRPDCPHPAELTFLPCLVRHCRPPLPGSRRASNHGLSNAKKPTARAKLWASLFSAPSDPLISTGAHITPSLPANENGTSRMLPRRWARNVKPG